ncbi:MAG TPA: hypothetical protein VH914_01200, partial [Acidimicrobiia bacterium]|nr:hypothetical protein [Acidimicrobiia bacterium]
MLVHPALAEVVAALEGGGFWANAYDVQWRLVAVTAEMAATVDRSLVSDLFGFSPEALVVEGPMDPSLDVYRASLRHKGEWILADLGVDREELRQMLHPALRDVVDDLAPCGSVATWWATPSMYMGDEIGLVTVALRVRDADDHVIGTVEVTKPGVGMNTLAMLTAFGDRNHFSQMV